MTRSHKRRRTRLLLPTRRNSLKIEGDAGTNSIEVKSLDSQFSGTLGLYGSVLDSFGVPVDDPFSDSITFSGDIDLQGGFLDAWADHITVNQNVHITAGDDGIVFRPRQIGIGKLENLSPVLGTSRSVSIDIGKGADIEASGGIYLITQAEDRSLADVIGASHEVDNFVIQPLLAKVAGLTALPVKVLVKNSSATITIGEGAVLHGGDTVGLYATAAAVASGSASGSLISIGYGRAVANATICVQKDAQIISDDAAVVITAGGEATASISTSTERSLDSTPNPGGKQIAASIAVSDANVTSCVTVANGAVISAGKTANIAASGDVSSEAEAEGGIFSDGTAALAFGLQFSNADIHTTVNGSVTSNMKPGSTVKIEIDPTVTDPNAIGYVDYDKDMIHVGPHALVTEDAITYTNRFGTSIGNLVDGREYFVVQQEDDPTTPGRDESEWIKLAPNERAAILAGQGFEAGNVVDLIPQSGLLATADNERAFEGSDVNADANTIELRDADNSPLNFNKFELGQAVVYHQGSAPIDGLTDGGTYYIIAPTSENNLQGDTRFATGQVVQLAESENEARGGVAIEIGDPASSATGYKFTAKHVLDFGLFDRHRHRRQAWRRGQILCGGRAAEREPESRASGTRSRKKSIPMSRT